MPCICADIPGELKAFVNEETKHPYKIGSPARHLHIFRRKTSLYRVEWYTDLRREKVYVEVAVGEEGDNNFVKEIERWIERKWRDLNAAHDDVLADNFSGKKVSWK